jgi:hypothetical protein
MKLIEKPNKIEEVWLKASRNGFTLRLLSIDGKGHQWICQNPALGIIVGDAIEVSREEAMAYALEDCLDYL